MKRNLLATGLSATALLGLVFGGALAAQERSERQQQHEQQTADVRIEQGQLVLVDAEGNEHRIDIGDRATVQMQQRVVVGPDGQREVKVVGQAVVVDPDGTTHRITLGEGEGAEWEGQAGIWLPDGRRVIMGELPDRLGQLVPGFAGRYMLGVSCTPLDFQTAEELGIEEAYGLRVVEVFDDSAAAQAGLQTDDILLRVDDRPLETLETLVDAVQQAGREDRELKLELRRGEESLTIEVKPTERTQPFAWPGRAFEGLEAWQTDPAQADQMRRAMEQFEQQMRQLQEQFGREGRMRIESFGPGAVWRELPREAREGVQQQLEEVRRQLEQMRQERQTELEQLRDQMRELREELQRIRPPGRDDGRN